MRILFLIILNLSFLKIQQTEISYKDKIKAHNQEVIREGEINRFLIDFGYCESGMNNCAINKIGCFSCYQFKEMTLKSIGVSITLKEFRKNPDCFPAKEQTKAMLKLMKINEESLKEVIKTWNGIYKIMPDGRQILITKSGILASSHLAGTKAVIKFLYEDNDKPRDIFGTKISTYMTKFAGYNF